MDMERKRKLLKELDDEVVDQEEERSELETSDSIEGNQIDEEVAPGLDVAEELSKEWKHQEKEREVAEEDAEIGEGLGIDEEEEEGEEPSQEIEEALEEDSSSLDSEEFEDEEEAAEE